MLNRLFQDNCDRNESDYGRDERSGLRLLGWYCLLVLPLFGVGYRLVRLQVDLKDVYAAEFKREIIDYEIIPARNGRIVAESVVLATDVEQYDVSAHFRWLEHPPNLDWLKQQARVTLNREQRRDPATVRKAEQQAYDNREMMWTRLSKLIDTPYLTVRQDRARIQQRVERIIRSVNRRREQRRQQSLPVTTDENVSDLEVPDWFKAIRQAVTTQPTRNRGDRIVVLEELDYHPVVEDVPLKVAAEIKAHPELYPGLRITMSTERRYPQATLAAHTVGSRTPLRSEELDQRRLRFPDGDPFLLTELDRIGRTGVEQTYDRRLRGINGRRRIVRNRRGEIVRTEVVRKPRSGQDIGLTIDTRLQTAAEQLLNAALNRDDDSLPVPNGASIVVLNVHTGAVLAAANAPGYDLNLLVESNAEEWNATLGDPRRPLFYRSIQMAIPPGSVFKTLSAVALLESHSIDPDASFHCQGFLNRPDQHRCLIFRHFGQGHGDTTLANALTQSCNVYFFHGAQRMGHEPLIHWAKQFGIGRRTGIDLPFEYSGHLPQPPKHKGEGERWYTGDTMGLAIGQSRLLVTPLQIARMMAAIANGGYLVTPHVVHDDGPRIVGEDHAAAMSVRSRRKIAGLDPMSLVRIREGLERVVQHPRGTGYKSVRLPEIKIAGKTGTAEVGGGRPDHAWFAGYVPADRPQVAFVVVLEHGGSGSRAAGPIAKQLVQSMLNSGTLQPESLARTDP
jgi:penicillin-binding protein 2